MESPYEKHIKNIMNKPYSKGLTECEIAYAASGCEHVKQAFETAKATETHIMILNTIDKSKESLRVTIPASIARNTTSGCEAYVTGSGDCILVCKNLTLQNRDILIHQIGSAFTFETLKAGS